MVRAFLGSKRIQELLRNRRVACQELSPHGLAFRPDRAVAVHSTVHARLQQVLPEHACQICDEIRVLDAARKLSGSLAESIAKKLSRTLQSDAAATQLAINRMDGAGRVAAVGVQKKYGVTM